MELLLLDESLRLRVFFEEPDCDFNDNICISIEEDCPENEKLLIHDQTNIYITPEQAEAFSQALLKAARMRRQSKDEKCD
jgi:hypothetical protein